MECVSSKTGLSTKDLDDIVQTIKKISSIKSAWLYGSRAKGTWRPGSDIDLAIDGPFIQYENVIHLSYELNEETHLPYHVDVVGVPFTENKNLLDHIRRVGIALKLE